MGAAFFYHMTRQPLEVTLAVLLQKSLGAGWSVVVRGGAPERLDWLDQKLWLGRDDGFLPHGLAGGRHDHLQPVLLTSGMERPNGAACLMAIDGAAVDAAEVAELERVCILFDGNNEDAVQIARDQWRALTADGCAAKYWSDDDGSWKMKAEAG
ncbi:MAG: DNA polymerase III subunit chi [Pseudomonadota bacterium]